MRILVTGKEVHIDEQDEARFNECTWYITKKGYVRSHSRKLNHVMLHRHLLNVTDIKILVDHIDGDKLNNCRSNMRLCSNSQNLANRPGIKGRRLKGVMWDKARKKFRAAITVNYKAIFLGRFDSERDAAIAYNSAAVEHFGEFAYLNNV